MVVVNVPKVIRDKLGEEGADALVQLLNQVGGHAATKADLNDASVKMETKLDREITGVKVSLEKKMAEVESSLDKKIVEVKSSLEKKIAQVESSLEKKIAQVEFSVEKKMAEAKADILKWNIVLWVTVLLGIIGTALFL